MEETILLPPTDNWLFVGTYGYVIAYDISSEFYQKIWKTNLSKSGFGNVTMYCNKTNVYAGCGSKLYSLSTWDGNIQWEVNLHGLIRDVDVRFAHDILICGCRGFVNAVSVNGDKLWSFKLKNTGYSIVTTMIVDNIIYATSSGYIFAISLEGQLIWKFNNEGQLFAGVSLSCISQDQLSIGMRGYLRRLHRTTGEQVGQSFCLKGTGYQFVIQLLWKDHLYIAANGKISAHNPSTFEYIWKNSLKGYGYDYCCSLLPHITSNSTPTILVGFRGYVLSLHALTGTIQWSVSLPGTGFTFVSLCPTPAYLYVASRGNLFKLNPENGEMEDHISLIGMGHVTLGTIEYQMDQQSSNLLLYSEKQRSDRK